MTHADINNAVRALKYLGMPDKVRAGVRNAYGYSVPVERVARILKSIGDKRPVRPAGDEPLPSDAYDYDYRVHPNARPQAVEVRPVHTFNRPAFKKRELLPEKVPAPSPNPFIGLFQFKALAASIAEDFGVTAEAVLGKGRFRKLILPRLVLTKLCLERGMSSCQIARKMGGRDHTTILNQRDKFDAYARLYPEVARSYARHVALREEAEKAREVGE